jgi:polygalacturonase
METMIRHFYVMPVRKITFSGLLLVAVLLSAAVAGMAGPVRLIEATKMGAVGDGTTLNTAAIQRAIDGCSADGGGTIRFLAGRYLTGTIQLKDNVTLSLDDQAVLLGSTNAADYRNLDPFIDGVGAKMGYALVVSVGASHVGIEGAGAIDGQGAAVKAAQSPYAIRPFLVRWVRCRDVTVRGVHLLFSGAWTMNFFQCANATVEQVTIRSYGLQNNDGMDIDSCERVRIQDCDINSGDDSLCLKATSPKPCRHITITGCKLQTGCNAIKFGTESLGDFEHVRVSDCQVRKAGMTGIALYTVDGAHLQDVTLDGVTMTNVTVPINLRLGARLKTFRAGDQPKPPGTLRDVTIKNVTVTGARKTGILINGIPGHPVESLDLENIQIEVDGGRKASDAQVQLPEAVAAYPEYNMFGNVMPAYGIYARHVRGVNFKNVRVAVNKPDGRPCTIFVDVEGVKPSDFAVQSK